MTRREFIRGTGAGAAVLVSGGIAFESLSRGRSVRGSALVGEPLGPTEERILWHAAMAPSSHNVQPWTVRIVERHRWIVGVDPQRSLPAVDPANREQALSLGAFLETLVAAAGASGLAVEIEPLSGGQGAASLEHSFQH